MEPNEILALWEKSLAYIALEHLNARGKKGLAEMADMSRQWVAAFLAHGEPISQPTFEKMKAAMDAYNKEQAEYLRNLGSD